MPEKQLILSAEDLAYWYLRLNGCFTITNFVVHPDSGTNQKTDIDVLAVRFPFRAELSDVRDAEFFEQSRAHTLVLLAEVKKGPCLLNQTWLSPGREALEPVIRAAGMFPQYEVPPVAAALRHSGQYRSQLYLVSFVAFGEEKDKDLATSFPDMPQILWRDVLVFIHGRFRRLLRQKSSSAQWDNTGKELYALARRLASPDDFVASVRVENDVVLTGGGQMSLDRERRPKRAN